MKPIILTYLAAEDIETIRNGFTSRQLRINRMVRWCEEAYDQGALLTQLDLAVLLNCCDAVVSDIAKKTRHSKEAVDRYIRDLGSRGYPLRERKAH